MKYKYLFDELIEQEYDKIQKGIIKSDQTNKRYEWKVIVSALKKPDLNTEALYQEFNNEIDKDITVEEYDEMLRAVNLDFEQKRRYISEEMKRMSHVVRKFLDGENQAIEQMEKFLCNLNERDQMERRLYFKAKYLLCHLIGIEKEFKSEEGKVVLAYCMEPFCAKILRMFYKDVIHEMGVISKKNQVNYVMENTRKVLLENSTKEVAGTDEEQMRFQLTNYRNTLELLETMFDELKESMDESATEARNEAVKDFFTSLNSSDYGNILDNILVVDKRLQKIRKDHIRIQPELMPLAIIFKQLMRFVKESEIRPIDQTGRKFVGYYNDIIKMNYEGEPYTNDKEKKRLEVVSPGWKYKDIVISLPTVREV
ncbi:hypothetical protein lbkm_1908 [Lachnospiraceae bacterium KM106-2]|nr:hypothetical protein lbkm_1908 [Lachnospiraceae bacterium KM106-2]